MKRIRSWRQYVRHQQSRERSELGNRRRARRRHGGTKPQRIVGRTVDSYISAAPAFSPVIAPSVFSMAANPIPTIKFFDRLTAHYERRRSVFVALRDSRIIDYDALVVLLSIMIRFKSAGVAFAGNFPRDKNAQAVLARSGFFDSLYRRDFTSQDRYIVGRSNGIHTHANKNVDPELSANIIEGASATVWGSPRRCQGVQRVFIELMQNTNNHASLHGQGEKHWWLSVNHRPKEAKSLFTFFDFGVGVFGSLDNKSPGSKWFGWRSKLFTLFTQTDNAEILAKMLQGELHRTVTGQHFRGKGLPGINEVLERGGISRLLIITNDVYADVANKEYRLLSIPFNGTLVSWELGVANNSDPATI
jgi:hypothetical protein